MMRHGCIRKRLFFYIFEDSKIHAYWDACKEGWYFPIVGVYGALTDKPDQRGATFYWSKLKQRLKKEGGEVLTICKQLKMPAPDGEMTETELSSLNM
jgi:hypothetical protein